MPGNAARVGDSTAHGGVIMPPGAVTVMIGGQPAARVGDNHVCPMVNPAPVPPPHVGGPILPPGVPTVMICGQPAACVGDMLTCSGPPDTIIPPGCPTVMINSGGGGGGGAGGGGGGAIQASPAAVKIDEGHYLSVNFQDKGGKPIMGVDYVIKTPDGKEIRGTLAGIIRKSGLQQGSYEITLKCIAKAAWSVKDAKVGDKVKLQVETSGIAAGEKATIEIFIKDANFADHLLHTIESQVSGDKIEEEWELELDDRFLGDQDSKKEKGAYLSPLFYFTVRTAGISARSGILQYKDYFEIELNDEDGKPIGGAKYHAFLPDGSIREGTLDSNGYAKLEKVSPGRVRVEFEPN